mgnify:CR=1 FL=1
MVHVLIPLNLRAGTVTRLDASRALVWEATLCYPVVDGDVLLIEKQRGLGEGKLVGAGGKLEADETPRACVIREVQEELDVAISAPEKLGEFTFRFGDEDPRLVHVFRTDTVDGTPSASAEAVPRWFPADDLPYDRMWADDRYWLPHLLDGEPFEAHFEFDADGEQLLSKTVNTVDDAAKDWSVD